MKLYFSVLVAAATLTASVSETVGKSPYRASALFGSDHVVDRTESATYSCTYESTWTSDYHPVDYPDGAHNSPPVLVAHNSKYVMFAPGELVSEEIKMVAETGDATMLLDELAASGSDIKSYTVGSAMFFEAQESRRLLKTPGEALQGVRKQTLPDQLTFTPEFNKFSSITMLAPSPDWFTGVSGFEPVLEDEEKRLVWAKSFELETYPYDAGTDSGITFLADDLPTDPQEKCAVFTVNSTSTGIFENPAGDAILGVGIWKCTLDSVRLDCKNPECSGGTKATGKALMITSAVSSLLAIGAFVLW